MRHLFTFLFVLTTFSAVFAGNDGFWGDKEPLVNEFSVYPNPTSGNLNVLLDTFDDSKGLTLKVYNLIGKQLESHKIEPFSGEKVVNLDLSKFPKGFYMIEISNGNQVRTKKVTLI